MFPGGTAARNGAKAEFVCSHLGGLALALCEGFGVVLAARDVLLLPGVPTLFPPAARSFPWQEGLAGAEGGDPRPVPCSCGTPFPAPGPELSVLRGFAAGGSSSSAAVAAVLQGHRGSNAWQQPDNTVT